MSKHSEKILLLNGGGLDSCAQLMLGSSYGWDITSVHIDYGQAAAEAEKRAVQKIAGYTKTEAYYIGINRMNISNLGERGRHVEMKPLIPGHALTIDDPISDRAWFSDRARYEMQGRNLMLLSIGLVVSNKQFGKLMIANNQMTTNFVDATDAFVTRFNTVLVFLGSTCIAISPFSDRTKLEAVQLAYKIDPIVLQAHSCYRATECGVCPHCLLKKGIVQACAG